MVERERGGCYHQITQTSKAEEVTEEKINVIKHDRKLSIGTLSFLTIYEITELSNEDAMVCRQKKHSGEQDMFMCCSVMELAT